MLHPILFAFFLISLGIQLGYTLFYYNRILGFMNHSEDPGIEPVSVVVCTHNRVESLRKLINRLLEQDFDLYQIVVVNDRSTDETGPYLQELSDRKLITYIELEETPMEYNPKKYGLVKGIEASKHDIILLTDDDCYPFSKDWIRQMAQRFQASHQIVLGYSQYNSEPGWLNRFIRYETLLTGMSYLSWALSGYPYMGVGRNLAFRRSFFKRKGGYQGYESITGGDDDLFVNKNQDGTNTNVCIGPDSLVMSIAKQNLNSYFAQKTRHLSVGKKYKLSDKIRIGVQTLTHLLFWVTFIILVTASMQPLFILVGFLLRVAVNGWVYSRIARKLGDHFNIWYSPFLDFLYLFYYVIVGLTALCSKTIKWT